MPHKKTKYLFLFYHMILKFRSIMDYGDGVSGPLI